MTDSTTNDSAPAPAAVAAPALDAYVVRYGSTRNVAEFTWKGAPSLKRSDAVLVRSSRGVEWGEVLCPATDRTREQLKSVEQTGKILRQADDEAWQKLDEVRLRERDIFHKAREIISGHRLQMNLVDVEYIFGGERVIFYYLAEQRVDFRELVKSLAREFQTRIEMRQIGVRDEARLLADFGDCGKPVCCGTHLHEMPPVSMKMAKMQKATLDPNKISGRCGRLKCCLRYEFDTYEEYRRELPNAGATVLTRHGQGKVLAQEILARKVLVDFEGGRRMLIDLAEITTVITSRGGAKKKKPTDGDDASDADDQADDTAGESSGSDLQSGREAPARRPGPRDDRRRDRSGSRPSSSDHAAPADHAASAEQADPTEHPDPTDP